MKDVRQKIGVIGAGAVGSASLLSAVLRRDAREIIVVNRDRKRARAIATDLQYGAGLSSGIDIRDGDYQDLSGAALVMITAGVNEKTGGATDRNDPAGRLRLLETNVGVYQEILPKVAAAALDAVILVLTDPPDPLADFVRTFGFTRVLSSGTFLDSLRFRFHLARHMNAAPREVLAPTPLSLRTWTRCELIRGDLQPHADAIGLRRINGVVVGRPRREPVYPHPIRHIRQVPIPPVRRFCNMVEVPRVGTVSDDAVVCGCAAAGVVGPADDRGVVGRGFERGPRDDLPALGSFTRRALLGCGWV
jgi:hypothetical protein